MAGRKGNPMSWKSILTSIVSVTVSCGFAVVTDWTVADVTLSGTGRVTQATTHAIPNVEFLIEWLGRQYTNDMKTLSGRIKWHGKPIAQEIDDTNRMCKVERFADGTIHVEPYRKDRKGDFAARTNSVSWKAKVAKRKAALEKRRAEIAARRNVLPGLKEAQLKTFDSKNTVSNVTVNINIGGGNGR